VRPLRQPAETRGPVLQEVRDTRAGPAPFKWGNGTAGTANTGGGGGSGGFSSGTNYYGGNGGSGIVIIRYRYQ